MGRSIPPWLSTGTSSFAALSSSKCGLHCSGMLCQLSIDGCRSFPNRHHRLHQDPCDCCLSCCIPARNLGTEQGIPSDDAMPPNVSGLLPMHNTKLAEIQQKQCRIVPTLPRIGGSQSSKGGASAFEDLEQQKNHPHLDFFLVASEYISAGETL
jgi:hypothetical protein